MMINCSTIPGSFFLKKRWEKFQSVSMFLNDYEFIKIFHKTFINQVEFLWYLYELILPLFLFVRLLQISNIIRSVVLI